MINKYIAQKGQGYANKVIQFRFQENVDLLEAITEAVNNENIESAIIISGIGALRKAVCRNLINFPKEYPVKDKNRLYYEIEKPLELLNLSGWIARKQDGTPEIHTHFSVSTIDNNKVLGFGGHLCKGTITGIKLVVSLLILENDNFYSDFDEMTKTNDLFCY